MVLSTAARLAVPPTCARVRSNFVFFAGCENLNGLGTELQKFFEKQGGIDRYETCIFVGDGANDLCALLQLRSSDCGFVRSGFELEKRIDKEGQQWGLQCGVRKWGEAWECEKLLDTL